MKDEVMKKELNVTMTLPLDDKSSIIHSDPHRFKQVMNNLLMNAVKFTSSGEIEIG